MTECAFRVKYPGDGAAPDFSPLLDLVEIEQDRPTHGRRTSEFDDELHSDNQYLHAAQWVVSSGLAAGVLKILGDVLVKYLDTRRSFVQVEVGKKKMTIVAPLSKSEIEDILKELAPSDPK